MKRIALLGAVPLAALSLATMAPSIASAAPSAESFSHVLGTVRIDPEDPTRATVQARYRCTGEAHLWVSVKQTEDRTADPRLAEEGSGGISAAWSDSHRNEITCDGRIHVDTFEVDQLEPLWGSDDPKSSVYEPLAKGVGYVQFCLYDETTGEGGATDNSFRNPADGAGMLPGTPRSRELPDLRSLKWRNPRRRRRPGVLGPASCWWAILGSNQ